MIYVSLKCFSHSGMFIEFQLNSVQRRDVHWVEPNTSSLHQSLEQIKFASLLFVMGVQLSCEENGNNWT